MAMLNNQMVFILGIVSEDTQLRWIHFEDKVWNNMEQPLFLLINPNVCWKNHVSLLFWLNQQFFYFPILLHILFHMFPRVFHMFHV